MLKYFNKKRKSGQSTVEYVILVILVIGALGAIAMYGRRALQGGYQDKADQIGDQFSPGNTNMTRTKTTTSSVKEEKTDGATTKTMLEPETTSETMNMFIINTEFEYWGK